MTSGRCPTCGAELPENAPQGLCPKCLLVGVAAPTEAGSTPEQRRAPPAVEAVRAAFPQLEILELIGQGGMGAVFKARQPKLNRFVALKILPESMARDPAFAERLAREGQLLARLTHPNVVTVHDFGSANGFFYLLMEYVDGVNLRQAMQAGRFTAEQALAIVPMICEALQYAHDEGVLHRDIKPENILLDTKGRVKLVDFGIAKLAGRDEAPAAGSNPGAPADIALTQTGSALGTPSYMAPEQRSSPSTVDQRADIYSLGVVFYEMLTGELPTGNFARPSSRTPMDPRVDDVVLRAMARQKEQRFGTAAEVRTRIEAITSSFESARSPIPGIPAAAKVYPIALGVPLKKWLFGGLLVLWGLLVHQLSLSHLFRYSWSVLNQGWVELTVGLTGIGVIAWCGWRVWRHHQLLVPALQPLVYRPDASATRLQTSNHWTLDRWLALAWLAVLGVMVMTMIGMLLSQTMMLAQVAANGSMLGPGVGRKVGFALETILSPSILPILLMLLFVRRELQRPPTICPADPPAWMERAPLYSVIFAIVTSLPVPMTTFTANAIAFTTVGFGAVVVVLGLAFMARSRIWRAIALACLLAVLIPGTTGLLFFLLAAARDQLPVEWSRPVGPFNAMFLAAGTQCLGLLCCGIGLIALLLASSRAAFGLPPSGNKSNYRT